MAEWLRWLISLSPLTIRSSHRCDWCGFEPHTGHKWDKSSSTCGCVRWFFPGYSRFRPTFWLARLDMSEIILKGTLNWTKTKKKFFYFILKPSTVLKCSPKFNSLTCCTQKGLKASGKTKGESRRLKICWLLVAKSPHVGVSLCDIY